MRFMQALWAKPHTTFDGEVPPFTIWMMGASPCARNLAAFRSGSAVTLRQTFTASPNTVTDTYSSTTHRGPRHWQPSRSWAR